MPRKYIFPQVIQRTIQPQHNFNITLRLQNVSVTAHKAGNKQIHGCEGEGEVSVLSTIKHDLTPTSNIINNTAGGEDHEDRDPLEMSRKVGIAALFTLKLEDLNEISFKKEVFE